MNRTVLNVYVPPNDTKFLRRSATWKGWKTLPYNICRGKEFLGDLCTYKHDEMGEMGQVMDDPSIMKPKPLELLDCFEIL